jgi:hypothetical protein
VDDTVRITRRGLLRAGLLGSALLWAGGQIGCGGRHAASRPAAGSGERQALTPAGEAILGAVIPVVLGSLLPGDEKERRRVLAIGLDTIDRYLAFLPEALQREAGDAFATLDLLPARVLLVGTWRPWSETPPATVAAFLRSARSSRFDLVRRIFVFLQSLAVLAWFDQRAAWPAIGYPGPPVERTSANWSLE